MDFLSGVFMLFGKEGEREREHINHINPADLSQDEVRDGCVGVDDDGGHFVVSDLLQQRGGVQAVVQHAHRQRLPGDEEATHQLLQS